MRRHLRSGSCLSASHFAEVWLQRLRCADRERGKAFRQQGGEAFDFDELACPPFAVELVDHFAADESVHNILNSRSDLVSGIF